MVPVFQKNLQGWRQDLRISGHPGFEAMGQGQISQLSPGLGSGQTLLFRQRLNQQLHHLVIGQAAGIEDTIIAAFLIPGLLIIGLQVAGPVPVHPGHEFLGFLPGPGFPGP